jgi:uncharacterized protein YjdB
MLSCGVSAAAATEMTAVRLSPATLELAMGGAPQTLTATVEPPNAAGRDALKWSVDPPPPSSLVWFTLGTGAASNTATVGPMAPGTASITVSAPNGVKATCTVTIAHGIPVTGVTLSRTAMALEPGASDALVATVLPAGATNKSVAWTVAPVGVVDIAPDGISAIVTAGTPGTAVVTVTTEDGGHTDSCTVTVAADVPVASVTVFPTTLSLTPTGSATLTATVSPAGADQSVTWTAAPATGIVNVAPNGSNGLSVTVTGVAPGGATITVASAADPTKKAECMVTVSPAGVPVADVTLNWSTLSLNVGDVYPLVATVLPPNASNRDVTWSSSDSGVAAVEDGVVTAVAIGTADITVTSVDGGKTATCKVTVEDIAGIYVAGTAYINDIGYATVWKNGTARYSEIVAAEAWSVFASGSSVHVAGCEWGEDYNRATLWTNAVSQCLSEQRSHAWSVFASGSDVYVAGHIESRAALWKNGIAQPLATTGQSYAYSVYAIGGDVYVAGTDNYGSGSRATLWKNGSPTQLSAVGSEARSVFVSGGAVYVAGASGARATLWIDGAAQQLSASSSEGRSVHVSGGHVHVAGTIGSRATLWTDGAAQQLDSGLSSAESVFVSDGVAYVAGFNMDSAVLWTDGAPQALSDDYSSARSVFVSAP